MFKYSYILLVSVSLFFVACGDSDCCDGKEVTETLGEVEEPTPKTIVKAPPSAVIIADRLECTVGESLSFDGRSDSWDTDGTINSYSWSIGDSTVSTNPNPSLLCLNLGVQNICLKVKDDDNLTSSEVCKSITVKEKLNIKPIARITGTPETCTIGDTIDLNATESSDADGEVLRYSWTPQSTEKLAIFSCDQLGDKQICLTVTDNDDQQSDQNCTTVIVLAQPNLRPIASFSPDPLICTQGETIELNATASSDRDGNISIYSWNKPELIGDMPIYACDAIGEDQICLTVQDDKDLNSTQICKNITIARRENIIPTAVVTNVATECEVGTNIYPEYSQSLDSDGNVTTIQWIINNVTILGQNSPTVPCSEGNQTICLTVQDNEGALSDMVCQTIIGKNPIIIPPSTIPPISVITFGVYDGAGFIFDCSNSYDGDAIDSDQTPQNDIGPITSIWTVMKYHKDGFIEGPHGGNTCQKWIGIDDGIDFLEITLTVTDDDGEESNTTKQYTFDGATLIEK